jgi:hypothetical protein
MLGISSRSLNLAALLSIGLASLVATPAASQDAWHNFWGDRGSYDRGTCDCGDSGYGYDRRHDDGRWHRAHYYYRPPYVHPERGYWNCEPGGDNCVWVHRGHR